MSSLTYKDSGVDITKGNQLIDKIKPIAKSTLRPGVLAGLGGFGAMFEIPLDRYKNPVLISGTDGVGTKLMVAEMLKKHDTIGIDLVAMCVNDLIVQGAEPLFFLDYYATGSLNTEIATSVIEGIGEGCRLSGCSLIGGETAEMPGMYKGEEYDLAGFCVGIVEKDNIIDYINHPKRIFPIGRLDKTSEGLIFLTNDGDIVNKILRAKNKHEKEYHVTVDKPINNDFVKQMSKGIPILNTVTRPCEVKMVKDYEFKIILTQGLNRQIRRMCEHLGYRVKKLNRIRIMNINLDIRVGEWRYFSDAEISELKELLSKSS